MSTPGEVGGYQVVAPMGQGGAASVYRALSPGGEAVALKLLAPEHRGEPAWRRRLERERETCARLRHPNLVHLVGSGHDARHGPYLATRLLEGRTLRERTAGLALPPPLCYLLLDPLLAGLEAMHRAGFVHRDLKPENVVVTDDGQVVIVDLGLSWHAERSRLTREGCVAGSVPYMSPEQIHGGPITPSCDIWSAGVMLYELVSGERPFSRQLAGEEVAAILAGAHTPLGEADRRVSPDLSALVEACLALEPERRPADAAALRGRLERLEDHDSTVDPGVDSGVDLTALLADPRAAMEQAAELQYACWRARAEQAVAAGESFAALDAVDRALAYRPRAAELQPLVDRAAVVDGAAGTDGRRRRWPIVASVGAALVAALGVGGWALLHREAPPEPPPVEPPPIERAPGAQPAREPSPALEARTGVEGEAGSREDSKRSEAATRRFYGTVGEMVQFLGKGAREKVTGAEQKQAPRAPPSTKKASSPKKAARNREADRAALDVIDGFGALITDLASDKKRAEDVDVSPDGQEAAVKMLGGLFRLMQEGARGKRGNERRRNQGKANR